MLIKRINKWIGGTLAIVILLSALVGYLPTSNCHCRDSKTPKNQKVQCPFGQLRNLSISLTTVPVFDLSVVVRKVQTTELFAHKKLEASSPLLAFDAQAPPSFLKIS